MQCVKYLLFYSIILRSLGRVFSIISKLYYEGWKSMFLRFIIRHDTLYISMRSVGWMYMRPMSWMYGHNVDILYLIGFDQDCVVGQMY